MLSARSVSKAGSGPFLDPAELDRMRIKVVLPVLALAAVTSVLLFRLRPGAVVPVERPLLSADQNAPREPADSPAATKKPLKPTSDRAAWSPRREFAEEDFAGPDFIADANEDYVDARIEELQKLGMTDNPESLVMILSELTNHDLRIRNAAVAAAVQFGSRDAIPALQDAISRTENLQEKVDLQNSIDFLKLPSILEARTAVQ